MTDLEMYHFVVGSEPNVVAVSAVSHVTERGAALDIGAGNLRDSRFLKKEGFDRVVAVDSAQDSLSYAVPAVELHIQPIQNFAIEAATYNLIICCNVFFHMSHRDIMGVLSRSANGLLPGGIMAFNILGVMDRFFKTDDVHPKYNLQTLTELTNGFDVVSVSEYLPDSDALDSLGFMESPQLHHWHVILRRP